VRGSTRPYYVFGGERRCRGGGDWCEGKVAEQRRDEGVCGVDRVREGIERSSILLTERRGSSWQGE
jgi:hypothetical protein